MDILLGRNFTESPEIAYVRVKDQLFFGYCDQNPFKEMEVELVTRKVDVVLKEDTVLRRNQINCVQVSINEVDQVLPMQTQSAEDIHLGKGEKIGEIKR